MNKKLLLVFLLTGGASLSASKISRGFEALAIYDYFKAKELFYKTNGRKADAYACYGLATIYYRNDNPFHHIDSALRYLHLGWQDFRENKECRIYGPFTIDSGSYGALADTINGIQFRRALNKNTVASYENFLKNCYLASSALRQRATDLRDELEFDAVAAVNKSEATRQFMFLHPSSTFAGEARALYERQVYEESTEYRNAGSYLTFLRENPGNKMVNQAYEKLFGIYRDNKDANGLALFVNEFPEAPQNLEAWKLLFSLTVKTYSYAELKRFLDRFPQFPLKNTILKELELNKLVLYPYGKGDHVGYINEKGKMIIHPTYYDAGEFREGLALVQNGDSTSFINKENKNPFGRAFENAGNFQNGLAPVKTGGKWFFINRLGQQMSPYYEEINEMSDNVYVVKQGGRYGAVDQFGQILIEPRYEKLGDFTNDLAYYTQNGKYGFVAVSGRSFPAQFDWISSFSGYGQAVFKMGDRFGLIDDSGKKLLEAEYDQVLKQNDSVYLVVKGGHYGFYHADGCFVYDPASDYMMSVQSGRYTNGRHFKLTRKLQQAIANPNGILLTPYGAFEEVHLPSDGRMRVKRRDRYGYADLQGKIVINCRYDLATDFSDNTAIAVLKDKKYLLDTGGRELFSTDKELTALGRSFFQVGEEPAAIVNLQGRVLFSDVRNIQEVAAGVYAFENAAGEINLIYEKEE